MNIHHSCRNDDWQTPDLILDKIRSVLHIIHLDPASSLEANTRVKAIRYIDKNEDGLISNWDLKGGNVYLNPPGGKDGNKSLAIKFWIKLMQELYFKRLGHAIFMSFSIEHLQSSQGKGVPSIKKFLYCVPQKRIAFVDPTGNNRVAPSHSNMIVYIPGLIDKSYKFKEVFSSLGDI